MYRTVLLLAIMLTVTVSPFVRAQEQGQPSTAQLNVIRANCVDAQPTFSRVQQSDKTSRINRGYEYEMLSRLMAAFNSRAALNRIDSPELLSITSDFEKAFKSFSEAYTKYDDNLSELIRIKCREMPEEFYATLREARQHREELSRRVGEMDELLTQYQANLDTIKKVVGDE